jgi:exodeoxyribonuclease V beta subunit
VNIFDPKTSPIPAGTALIEASAGTGKTFAIVELAVRLHLEESIDPHRLAVITFGRAATSELKDRLRERTDDLERAQVATIHEFCAATLRELGTLADQDLPATLEDLTGLIEETATDLYLETFRKEVPAFSLESALQIAKSVADHPEAKVMSGSPEAEFATAFRERFEQSKRRERTGSYDDILTRLRDVLREPKAAAAFASRYDAVLVDEFQDTDLVQWEILEHLIASNPSGSNNRKPRLLLVGDPKQSIYRFRGADPIAYQLAVSAADTRLTLGTNYRSDEAVVTPLLEMFAGVQLGEGVEVPALDVAHKGSRLTPAAPRVRLRCNEPDKPGTIGTIWNQIQNDVVAEISELLAETRINTEGKTRELLPSDIAVLVRTNDRGREYAAALSAAGIPAAFSGADSIFDSEAAADWLTVLLGLSEPTRASRRRALITDLVGASVEELLSGNDEVVSYRTAKLARIGEALEDKGPLAALEAALDDEFTAKVLSQPLGERELTDLRQVAEELLGHGPTASDYAIWLDTQINHSASLDAKTRKLETDLDAVQILTIHRSKGLQWPVVMLPDLWSQRPFPDKGEPLVFHDRGELRLDVSASSIGRNERFSQSQLEEADDLLRQLYVACTRAQSHLTLWWSRSIINMSGVANTSASPLQRLLFADRSRPGVPLRSYPLSRFNTLQDLPWLAKSQVEVSILKPRPIKKHRKRTDQANITEPRVFAREVDQAWRRTSYSGLTASAHELHYSAALLSDEPAEPQEAGQAAEGRLSPLAGFPGGTSFGSLVHLIYETLDWAPESLEQNLLADVEDALVRFPMPVDAGDLARSLAPALRTPLGGLADGRALCDFPISDRLAELDFEYPMPGKATLAQVARLFESLPSEDPLRNYSEALSELGKEQLWGYLNGSIDVVLRLGGRYLVIDYKTNSFAPVDELRPAMYTREAMAKAMIDSHYPLQASLYSVALHRFLSRRLPGYTPEANLGGIGYLFVRGMDGTQIDGCTTGVFEWRPPAAFTIELSRLIGGER